MHVVVNAAMSADGKLSSRRREQLAISGPTDFERVDALRAESDAVVVGVGTVLADDPSLTVKDVHRRRERVAAGRPPQPARVVVDSRARTPFDAAVLDDTAETFLLCSDAARIDRVRELEDRGITPIVAGEDRVDLETAFTALERTGVSKIMVEGGGELIFSLFESAIVDELFVYVGPTVIGGADAPTLADGAGFVEDFPTLELATVDRADEGVLLRWTVNEP